MESSAEVLTWHLTESVLRSQCANLVAIGSHQGCATVETDTCVCDCRNFSKPAQQAQQAVKITLSLGPCALIALSSGAAQAGISLLQACSLPATAHLILPACQKQLKPTSQQGCQEISLLMSAAACGQSSCHKQVQAGLRRAVCYAL